MLSGELFFVMISSSVEKYYDQYYGSEFTC